MDHPLLYYVSFYNLKRKAMSRVGPFQRPGAEIDAAFSTSSLEDRVEDFLTKLDRDERLLIERSRVKRCCCKTYFGSLAPENIRQNYMMAVTTSAANNLAISSLLIVIITTCDKVKCQKRANEAHQQLRKEFVSQEGFQRRCDHCETHATKTRKCGGCKLQTYCSEACQRAAWPTHKSHCLFFKSKQ